MKRRKITDEKGVGNIDNYRSTLPSGEINPQSFFKLMLLPASQSRKLRIPETFAEAYHEELCTSTNATLTVPTGETWEVTVIDQDNKLWFYRGWQEFVNNYAIAYGYFLLFNYEGNMKFNVHIFDLTACEISYQHDLRSSSPAVKERCHENPGLEQEALSENETGDSDDEKDVASELECSGSPLSSPDDYSDAEVVELGSDDDAAAAADDDDDDYDDDDDDYVDDEDEVESLDEGRRGHSTGKIGAGRGNSFTRLPDWFRPYRELMKAVTVAGIPIPKTCFFPSEVKHYNLYKGMYLNVPKAFARELQGQYADGEKFIKLKVADGRKWVVKCIHRSGKAMFGKGWITFARDNGLEVGDVCVYEVTPSNHNLLKVQVVRKSRMRASRLNLGR